MKRVLACINDCQDLNDEVAFRYQDTVMWADLIGCDLSAPINQMSPATEQVFDGYAIL